MMNPAGRGVKFTVLVAAALVFASFLVVRNMAAEGWDPTLFKAFGEDELPTREYGEARLGDIYLRRGLGHDGKFFFVQANDPWVLHPEENAAVLDRPLYRSQRMLYPVSEAGVCLGLE